jgi:hypothetical protein
LPFGFGGIARVGEGIIPGEVILGEHQRLGSNSVILSRTFHRKSEGISEFRASLDLKDEIDKLRFAWKKLQARTAEQQAQDHLRFQEMVKDYVAAKV